MKISKRLISQHGLSDEEYNKITAILHRRPNYLELGIFSTMWSEHCSYKSSKTHLKRLPAAAEHVIQGPGENAGVVDIGDGLAVIFKIESHNHPSYIEPYHGAATGVGGILRDIFTMGARPVAILNSLRFGSTDHPRTKYLLDGVVAGISGYGNRVGIPTVGGEVHFDKCYDGNILVNVFALGIVKKDRIFKGEASGVGNPVIYAGSKTGRDGIHGATMASEEFDDESEGKRPTVQVGDPFIEKLLIDACLELMETDYVVGIQDMGAAGLTCSIFEMAGRAGMGIDLQLDAVPAREEAMTPYELMLSESQERMLIVVKRGYEERVKEIFDKYDLDAVVIGKVTDTGRVKIFSNDKIEADLPVRALSEEAPEYRRPSVKPGCQDDIIQFDLKNIEEPVDYNEALLRLIGSPELSSRKWVYEQYDHIVGTNTIVQPGSDAAVIKIKGTRKAIAMSTDCNSRYCYLDPYTGGMIAVSESARNVVCAGARPLAVTDCLNFGNPEKPEIMWQFEEALKGISDACIALNTPIISGNVSFYNETNNVSIYPSPVITMVGLIDDSRFICTEWFKQPGDMIVLLGENKEDIGGSEYLNIIHGMQKGRPPFLDIEKEKSLQKVCIEAIYNGIIKSAHDCSEGGIAIALAESCISGEMQLGADIFLDDNIRPDALLFGESQSRVIISFEGRYLETILEIAARHEIKAKVIGRVMENFLKVRCNSIEILSLAVGNLNNIWQNGIPEFMK